MLPPSTSRHISFFVSATLFRDGILFRGNSRGPFEPVERPPPPPQTKFLLLVPALPARPAAIAITTSAPERTVFPRQSVIVRVLPLSRTGPIHPLCPGLDIVDCVLARPRTRRLFDSPRPEGTRQDVFHLHSSVIAFSDHRGESLGINAGRCGNEILSLARVRVENALSSIRFSKQLLEILRETQRGSKSFSSRRDQARQWFTFCRTSTWKPISFSDLKYSAAHYFRFILHPFSPPRSPIDLPSLQFQVNNDGTVTINLLAIAELAEGTTEATENATGEIAQPLNSRSDSSALRNKRGVLKRK